MNNDPIIHVEIEAPTIEDLRAFTDEIQPDLGCRATPKRKEGRIAIDAYLPETALQAARGARSASLVSIRVIENATDIGRARQTEVGGGNRFAVRGEVPRGLGRKE